MSQSLLIKGTYKNNKTNSIGCHNPQNNRNFNNGEIAHIMDMYGKHFINNLSKFKKIEVFADIDGKEIFNRQVSTVNPTIIKGFINDIINYGGALNG